MSDEYNWAVWVLVTIQKQESGRLPGAYNTSIPPLQDAPNLQQDRYLPLGSSPR